MTSKFSILNSQFSTQEGFTLVELMVVFSIAVLITGIGFASLLSYSRRQEVSQANADLKQVFQQAKFNALSFVKPVNSNCQEGDPLNSYTIVLNSTGYKLTALCGDNPVTVSEKELPQNISYYPIDKSCDQVTYQTLSGAVGGTDSNPLPCFVGIQGYGIQQCFEVDESGNTSDVSCANLPSPPPPPPTTHLAWGGCDSDGVKYCTVVAGAGSDSCSSAGQSTTTGCTQPPPTCTDKDGDGFYTTKGCGSHPTLVDCNDNNPNVNPYSLGGTTPDSVVGWDYNCDGSIEVGSQYISNGSIVPNGYGAIKQPSRSSDCPFGGTGKSNYTTTQPQTATSSMCGSSVISISGDGTGGYDELWSVDSNGACVARIGYVTLDTSPKPLVCR